MREDVRERIAEQPNWKLVISAVGVVAARFVAVAVTTEEQRSPTPRAPAAGAPIVGGRRQSLPAGATAAATRFLHGYLPFLYGQVGASRINRLTPELGRSLADQRARVTPAERARHPRVLQLGFAPGDATRAVLFEAQVSDGVSRYRVRMRVALRARRWVVVELPDAQVAVGPNGAD